MTKAQKKIRKEMLKWSSIGLNANFLSQDTGYAFSTCKREISKVVSENLTVINWDGDICIENTELFEATITN